MAAAAFHTELKTAQLERDGYKLAFETLQAAVVNVLNKVESTYPSEDLSEDIALELGKREEEACNVIEALEPVEVPYEPCATCIWVERLMKRLVESPSLNPKDGNRAIDQVYGYVRDALAKKKAKAAKKQPLSLIPAITKARSAGKEKIHDARTSTTTTTSSQPRA